MSAACMRLHRRGNGRGRWLRQRGAGPGVAIVTERGSSPLFSVDEAVIASLEPADLHGARLQDAGTAGIAVAARAVVALQPPAQPAEKAPQQLPGRVCHCSHRRRTVAGPWIVHSRALHQVVEACHESVLLFSEPLARAARLD